MRTFGIIATATLWSIIFSACDTLDNQQKTAPPNIGPTLVGTAEIPVFSNAYSAGTSIPKAVVENAVIYMPDNSWSYSHHPSVTYFQNMFYVVYSNGIRGEDEAGQRVMICSSSDFINWTTPKVLAEPAMGAYGEKMILTPGGICVLDGNLTVYITENDNDGISNTRLNPRLYALTSPDGSTWTKPKDIELPIFPSHRPVKLSTGRLTMTCNRSIYYCDSSSGTRDWRKCGNAEQDQSGQVTFAMERPSLCEGEIFEHSNGTLYCLFRNSTTPYSGYLWQAQSYDAGTTWTLPVRSQFTDNNTKSFFCALDDGRYLYIGTPDNTTQGTRHPLVLALSEDGFNYDKCYTLADDHYTQQYEGRWKGGDYGYPFAYVRQGWIYIVVSRHKERLDAIKCKISNLN